MWSRTLWSLALVVLVTIACTGGKAGEAVEQYVGHLRAGQIEQAHAMLAADKREVISVDALSQSLETPTLTHVSNIKVRGRRSLSGTGTCLYTQLSFDDRSSAGPRGFYIFYLSEEAGALRVVDVLTYDSIDGMVANFDRSREPFPCHSNSP